MSGIEIIALQEHHLDAVLAIEHDAFADPWSRSLFLQDLAAGHWTGFVATHAGCAVGYISCWLVMDECTINRIAVEKKYKRQGVATLLLQHLLGQAVERGARTCFLEVRADNTAALNFYRKSGFQQTGLRKRYYSETGQDAVLMSRFLGIKNG